MFPYMEIPLFNFFLAACCGLILRYAFVEEISWLNYKNLMHAHSHVAMLGWAYLILAFFIWKNFAPEVNRKIYSSLFWTGEVSVLGMLFSFPVEGYGIFSITFSTIFLLSALYFLWLVFRTQSAQNGPAIILLKTAIIWFFVSTIGVWAMGPIMVTKNGGSIYYYMAIQFFLHFQFNGWFTFVVLALFFQQLKHLNITFAENNFKKFYYLLVVSCVLTFALAVSWADPEEALFFGNSLGVIIQLLALFYFLKTINATVRSALRQHIQSFAFKFYAIAFISFVVKIIIQSVVVIPSLAVVSYTIRLYVLGFIHLIMLGAITSFVLGYGFSNNLMRYKEGLPRMGWILLLSGFIFTEIILFGQGTLLWAGVGYLPNYYAIIFSVSVLLPLGLLMAFIGQFKNIPITYNIQ